MNFISSKIVPAGLNSFWEPLPAAWQDLSPRKLLVLTVGYEPGSLTEVTLTKMLQACRLAPADYHILILPVGATAAWHAIQALLQPQYVLLLGVRPDQLGISALLQPYGLNAYGEAIFIPAASLPELEEYPEAKKQLWTGALKPAFVDGM